MTLLQGPYMADAGECPYLPDRRWTNIFYAAQDLPSAACERFLMAGFRRSGRSWYVPACNGCSECVGLRVPVRLFQPTGDQRRSVRKNPDVRLAVAETSFTDEKYEMYKRFVETRYPGRERVSQRGYTSFFLDHFGNTREFQYYIGERLVGVGFVDLTPKAASSMYLYFDTTESARSLGTFSAVREIEYCVETGREFLYLGFRVAGCKAMAYKSNYRPHQLLRPDGVWVEENVFNASRPAPTLPDGSAPEDPGDASPPPASPS